MKAGGYAVFKRKRALNLLGKQEPRHDTGNK
jgi:hypothetical protein